MKDPTVREASQTVNVRPDVPETVPADTDLWLMPRSKVGPGRQTCPAYYDRNR